MRIMIKTIYLSVWFQDAELRLEVVRLVKGEQRKGYFIIFLKKNTLFKRSHWVSNYSIFVSRNDSNIIGIEINPRFGGGFPLSYASGANYPGYIIHEYLMNETIQFNENWIENRVMLRFDSEIILDHNDFTSK